LWWSYYRALKKREGVIAGETKPNAVSNFVVVAKSRAGKSKTGTRQKRG
jgi:DNA-3-methyladenine glycosylase II